MQSTRRGWIEAGKILAQDPLAKVTCPVCSSAFLEVEDHAWDQDPNLFDRHLRCSNCGATEVIVRLRKAQ